MTNEFPFESIIHSLSLFSDDVLATPLSNMCIEFNKIVHTKEEQIRFLRDLRDMAVHIGGASPMIMKVFSVCLDHIPEPENEMIARRAELEKRIYG